MDNQNEKKLFTEFPPVTAEQWKDKVTEDLKGADFEKKLVWKPEPGLNFQPFYVADDIENLKYLDSNPGEFPFNRGNKIQNNDWKIIQLVDNTNYAEANKVAVDAVKRGAEGIIFNAQGLDKIENFELLLNGIDLAKISVSFTGLEVYSTFIQEFKHYCDKNGIESGAISGNLDFDPIGDFVVNGEFYKGQENCNSEVNNLFTSVSENFPKYKSINIKGQNFNNAGASVIQELAYALSCGNEYLALLTDKGYSAGKILNSIQITMAVGSSYFLEIAKLRAARLLWANIAKQYSPKDDDSCKAFINVVTSKWNMTVFDPYVNLLRSTTEAMSAAIGCCDSMTVLPFNACYKENDHFAERIARNQQIILKEESYFGKVTDPSSGSYYIENLTDSIAKHAWDLFVQIEEKGGFIKFAESGELKVEIEKTCNQRNIDIASRKTAVLGTNSFPNTGEMMLDEISIDNAEYNGKGLKLYRGAQAFEDLRLSTEKRFKNDGFRPKVLLLTYGNLAMRKARATFSANLLGCAGYEMLPEYNFENLEKAISDIQQKSVNIVVICSSDEEYISTAPELTKAIKEKYKDVIVVIAGNPKESMDMLKASGVDEFISVRSNALEVLNYFNHKLGVV
jgi:methylmalonyl-CoA mutase